MNENLNLVEILKDCPKGAKLYSTVYGEVEFDGINKREEYPVRYRNSGGTKLTVTAQGLMFSNYNGECTLFPSRVQRNWDLFTVPDCKKEKFDPQTLQPFDRVLARDEENEYWSCTFFSRIRDEKQTRYKYATSYDSYKCCIPYNDETKHLVGTTKEAPEFYRYWEE